MSQSCVRGSSFEQLVKPNSALYCSVRDPLNFDDTYRRLPLSSSFSLDLVHPPTLFLHSPRPHRLALPRLRSPVCGHVPSVHQFRPHLPTSYSSSITVHALSFVCVYPKLSRSFLLLRSASLFRLVPPFHAPSHSSEIDHSYP